MKKKNRKLNLSEVADSLANDLYKAKVINATTMRKFKSFNLAPVKDLTPTEIKRIRLRERVSQPVFAQCLNASPSTVKQWEQGEKHPKGTSLKLLNLIAKKGLGSLEC